MSKVLAYICTKGRYFTSLPLSIQAISLQTVKPDTLIIFDDNKKPLELEKSPVYHYLFRMLEDKRIHYEIIIGQKAGQHLNHQIANTLPDFDFAWRVDDDEVPENDVLHKLLSHMNSFVGAVGGLILIPGMPAFGEGSIKIRDIFTYPNIQWIPGGNIYEVEHLTSSFLYRTKIVPYEHRLSPAGHREETIFTHELFRKGYKLIVDQNAVTWHFRNPEGGIREYPDSFFAHDEDIFKEKLREWHIPLSSHTFPNE